MRGDSFADGHDNKEPDALERVEKAGAGGCEERKRHRWSIYLY